MDDHNRTDGVQCCVVLIVPVCNNMGALCYKMEDYTQSLKHFELALAIMLKSFDPEHPRISDIKSSIAAVMKKM